MSIESESFIEKTIFFVINQAFVYVLMFLDSLLCSILGLLSILVPVLHCLDTVALQQVLTCGNIGLAKTFIWFFP